MLTIVLVIKQATGYEQVYFCESLTARPGAFYSRDDKEGLNKRKSETSSSQCMSCIIQTGRSNVTDNA